MAALFSRVEANRDSREENTKGEDGHGKGTKSVQKEEFIVGLS